MLNIIDDKAVWGGGCFMVSWWKGCSKVSNKLASTQVASDPERQVRVMGRGGVGRPRVDQVMTDRHIEMRSLEKEREEEEEGERRDAGVAAVSSHSVTPGLCLRNCQSRGDASPRGHRPPGR